MTFRQQEFWRWARLQLCGNARKAYRMIENAAPSENHVFARMLLHASNSGVVPFGASPYRDGFRQDALLLFPWSYHLRATLSENWYYPKSKLRACKNTYDHNS